MKRVQYPLEQLREYLKNEGLDKLNYLMKRNEIENFRVPINDIGNVFATINRNGIIGVERTEYVEYTEIERNQILANRNRGGALFGGIGEVIPDYRETRVVDDIKNSDFIDSLKTANDLLSFSNRIKRLMEELLHSEESLIRMMEDIKSLNTGNKGRELILEKLAPSRNS